MQGVGKTNIPYQGCEGIFVHVVSVDIWFPSLLVPYPGSLLFQLEAQSCKC